MLGTPPQPAIVMGSSEPSSRTIATLLQVMLRGVDFAGDDFDSLTPVRALSDEERGMFVLTPKGLCLCACTMNWSMPLTLLENANEIAAELRVSLVLGEPRDDGGITDEQLTVHLLSRAGEFSSRGLSGWFEDELLELQAECRRAIL